MEKLGRNDHCNCGSGKKYKKCCLSKDTKPVIPFSKYSSRELLKVLALLLILPRNHGKNIRLEQTILDVLRRLNDSTENLDLQSLRADLSRYCKPQLSEDPPEEFFTETIYWHNGNNLIFPGIVSNGVEITQNLLNTIRVRTDIPKSFIEEVNPVINFFLFVHHNIATELDYSTRLFDDEHHEPLFVPEDSFITRYKNILSFDTNVMSDILKRFGVSHDVFGKFVFDQDSKKLDFANSEDSPLFQKPFLFISNEYVLVDPTAQLICLNDFILDIAKKHTCLDALLNFYRDIGVIELYPVFKRMGWTALNFDFPLNNPQLKTVLWKEALFEVDYGKVAYVAITTEIPTSNTQLDKKIIVFSNELQSRVETIGGLIKETFKDHQILFLHVIQKTRILSKTGLRLNSLKNIDLDIFFSYEELFLLTRKWKFDHLTLWKYVKYLDDYQSTHRFAPYNTHFSKMKWYMDHEESFYHPDEEPPTAVFFEFEIESEVRRSAIKMLDKQAIPYYSSKTISYVPCYRKEEYYPVYISQDINQGSISSCLLEYSCPVWCISSRQGDVMGDVYINGVLFWLHEMYELTREWMSSLGSVPILIRTTFDPKIYQQGELKDTNVEDISFRYQVNAEERLIDIYIPANLRNLLCTSGNRGEYLLMNFVLDVIGDLQRELNVGDRITEEIKGNILQQVMPNGPKKFINTLSDYRDLTLSGVDIDAPRPIPKADTSHVLQNQLKEFNNTKTFPKTITDLEEQRILLNSLVEHHYLEIKKQVMMYDGISLLTFLMRRQESLLQDYTFRQVNYPVKQAVYGKYYDVYDEYYKTANERNIANLTLRILIEWVACWMPAGSKHPCDDETDVLLARVCQVVNYGSLSDEIKYGLRNITMGTLPSGRLGVDRRKEDQVFKKMNTTVREAEYHGLADRFDEYYQRPDKKNIRRGNENYVEKVENIFRKEWGIGIHDLFVLTHALTGELLTRGTSVALLPRNELVSILTKAKFTTTEIEGWINILKFIKRDDVVKAPDGYKMPETYAWRYNRRLSYLLKPLLMIQQNDEEYFLISARHIYKATESIVANFHNGQLLLDKESKPIRALLAERNKIKGKEYRGEVLQWLNDNTALESYTQEIKIKSKGFFVANRDMGDIDILSIDHVRKIIYSIECKNTSQSKIPYEFHLEIMDYLGNGDKTGLIQKHINRDQWLQDNQDQVLQKLKLTSDYLITSLVISNHVLPTAFLRNIAIPVISFHELKKNGLPLCQSTTTI